MSGPRTMTWADLKYAMNNLSKDQLAEPVRIFNPLYERSFSATSVDHVESFKSGKQVAGDELAIIIFNGK